MVQRPEMCITTREINFKLSKTMQINFFVNRNRKKITVSGKKAKILTVNCKNHHPIQTPPRWLLIMILKCGHLNNCRTVCYPKKKRLCMKIYSAHSGE